MAPPPVRQIEEHFRNWVSIDDDDVQTVQIRTEIEITEELVLVIQNNDGLVVEVSDNDNDNDQPEEATPSAAEMQECLCQLAPWLDRTKFQKTDMFSAMKAEVNDHLRKIFPLRQTSLHRFFMLFTPKGEAGSAAV